MMPCPTPASDAPAAPAPPFHPAAPPPDRRRRDELFAALPAPWPEDLRPAIRSAVAASGRKLVVLDDDPTGTQTVHDVPVLTAWSEQALADELADARPACYVLTNSRALPGPEAWRRNQEIARQLRAASDRTGRPVALVSRSDSTLRGHYPGEVEALLAVLGHDGIVVLAPCFFEGGRYTVDDVHYAADEEGWLVPAGETPFAADATFGYRASNLREWVAEKTGGRVPAAAVASVSLDDLRRGGPARVRARLAALAPGTVCVVNAAHPRDLDVFVAGLLAAEAAGQRFLYRTAASFVPARAGLDPRPPLGRADLRLPAETGGLVVVGSHVPKSSAQLADLLAHAPGLHAVEVDARTLAAPDGPARDALVREVAAGADAALRARRQVVVATSRVVLTAGDPEATLALSRRVSAGLAAIVRALTVRPRYLVAKGGITSSDVATDGLGVRRAMIRGPLLPGVPVWEPDPTSRWPGLAYVVFPGNVGGPSALREAVTLLR